MIVPTDDSQESVAFYTTVMGFQYEGKTGSFDVVRVNLDLTLDFVQADLTPVHFAFAMDRDTFDGVFNRVKGAGLTYGDGPHSCTNMRGPGKALGSRVPSDSVFFHVHSGTIIKIHTY